MKRYLNYGIVLGVGLWRTLVWLLRHLVFVMLLFGRPVLSLIFGFASAACLVGLVIGLFVARDHQQMLWAFFGAGVVSTAFPFCYDALLLAVAPGRFPLLLSR